MSTDPGNIRTLQRRITAWADREFPDRTVDEVTRKLVTEEIHEFLANPRDPLEYADLLVLILDIAGLMGIDVQDALMVKIPILEKRRWRRDPVTGLRHHIKEEREDAIDG